MFLWEELHALSRPILLYGMGNGAEKVLELCRRYDVPIAGIFSSDSHAREGMFQGYPVLQRTRALSEYPDAAVVLAFGTERPEEIEDILALSRRHLLRIPDVPLLGGHSLTPEEVANRQEEIQQCRALLGDEASKTLFDALLDYKLSGDPETLMQGTADRSVLLSRLRLHGHEAFLDLGAYRGDTIEEFLSLTGGQYAAITALEPDAHNFKKLREAWGGRDSITLLPYASWNRAETLTFTGKGGRNCSIIPELPGQYRHLHSVRAIPVDTLHLDVSYVKMDVEGAERETLLGMADTIRRCRPKLLISAYHRPDDFITLPMLLQELCPGYRISLHRTPCIPAWEIQIAADYPVVL